MRTILPDSRRGKFTAPTLAGRAFAQRVAALTGTDPLLWLAPDTEGEDAMRARLVAAADLILGTNPVPDAADRFEEISDPQEREAAIAEAIVAEEMMADITAEAVRVTRAAADRRAERLAAEHAALTEDFDLVAPGWSRGECKAVKAASPFRDGPRYVVRCQDGSRRYGTGDLALLAG